jgi:hypothetical protein
MIPTLSATPRLPADPITEQAHNRGWDVSDRSIHLR